MSGLHDRSYMNKSAVLEYDYEFNKRKTSSIRNRIGRMEQTLSTICAIHELFNSDFLNCRVVKKFRNFGNPGGTGLRNFKILEFENFWLVNSRNC